jgi:O-antigen ligase
MAAEGVKHLSGAALWSATFSRALRDRSRHRALPQWLGVTTAAVIVGLIAARVASSRSTSGILILLAAVAPFVLMVVRDVRRTLIVVVIFDTAFQWDANFGYDKGAASLGALGGLNISATTIALFGLYLIWFAELAMRQTTMTLRVGRAAFPLVVYVGFTALSITVAGDKALAAYEVALLIQSLMLFVYIAGSLRTREEIHFVVASLISCLLVESALTLALPYIGSHKIIGISTYAQADTIGGSSGSRFGGTIGGPNTAASFFSLLIAPALAILATSASARMKKVAFLSVSFATVALVLTLSRGGWIAAVISFTFLTLVGVKRGWLSPRLPIASAIALTALVLPFSGTLTSRITGGDQGSASSRIPLMHLASSVIHDHPLLGVGANNLGIVFPHYVGPQYDQDWIYTVHNKYLLVWAEAGIGALIGFLWFLFSTLRRGWRLWRGNDLFLSPLALGFTAGIVGQMVHMNVDIFQSRPQVQLLWLVAALLVAMQNVVAESGEEHHPAQNQRPHTVGSPRLETNPGRLRTPA